MKKWFLIIPVILIGIIYMAWFFSKKKKYMYYFKEKSVKADFDIQTTLEDSVVNRHLTIYSNNILEEKGDKPLVIEFAWSEETPNAKKFKSIRLGLFDSTGKEIIPVDRKLSVEYMIGGGMTSKIEYNNNDEPLNKLIDWSKVNYEHEFAGKKYIMDRNIMSFDGSNTYKFNELPDKLKLKVFLDWENGSRVVETDLTKLEYEESRRKFNPKY